MLRWSIIDRDPQNIRSHIEFLVINSQEVPSRTGRRHVKILTRHISSQPLTSRPVPMPERDACGRQCVKKKAVTSHHVHPIQSCYVSRGHVGYYLIRRLQWLTCHVQHSEAVIANPRLL